MSHGRRRVPWVRCSVWVQAAGFFLLPSAIGVAALLLHGPMWLTVAYLALGAVLGAAWTVLARRRSNAAARASDGTASPSRVSLEAPADYAQPDRPAATAPAIEPDRAFDKPVRRQAVGYVYVTRDAAGAELAAYTDAIRAWAAVNGVTVTSVIHDVEGHNGDRRARPGLRGTLERLAAGEADTLVTARLVHLAPTVAQLPPVLRWFSDASRTIVAIDVRLDSATEAGRLALSTLADIAGWERERLSAQTRRGLEAARQRGSGAGPASVADVPDLKRRIEQLRRDGMTLQAIADVLNAEGVPTLRGGAKWRPSSVQRTTGYRRPTSQDPSEPPAASPSNGGSPASSG